jgi:uncharacterized protein (TIGR02145 family)
LEKYDKVELELRFDALMRFWEYTAQLSDSELDVLTQDGTVRPPKVSPIQTLQMPPQLKELYARINGNSEVYKASAVLMGGVPLLSLVHVPTQTQVGEIVHLGGEHFIWQIALPESALPKKAYPMCTMKSWALNAVPETGFIAATHVFSIDDVVGEFDVFLNACFSEMDDFIMNWAGNDAEINRRSNQNSKVLGPFVQSCVFKFYRDYIAIALHSESDRSVDFPLDYVEYCECMFETLPELQLNQLRTDDLWTFHSECAAKQVNWTSFYDNLPDEAKNQILSLSMSGAKKGIFESCLKGLPLYLGNVTVFENDDSLNAVCRCFVNSVITSEAYDTAVVFDFNNWISRFESQCYALLPQRDTNTLEGVITNSTDSWSCGNPISYQGYKYRTVLIGEKCWFAENLQSANYSNGDPISVFLENEAWFKTSEGASAVYGENGDADWNCLDDSLRNRPSSLVKHFGRLYNWYAVNDPRGLCPRGWKVSSDEDWMVLEVTLGLEYEDGLFEDGLRGENHGDALKHFELWCENTYNPKDASFAIAASAQDIRSGESADDFLRRVGTTSTHDSKSAPTNLYGFSALPSGYRHATGVFVGGGTNATWWTSTPFDAVGDYAWYRSLYSEHGRIDRFSFSPHNTGKAVRCICEKDP